MSSEAIKLEHITKVYKLYNRNRDRLKDSLGLTKKKCYTEHFALRDVSMEIHQGETVGIIGVNGSGKSTIQEDHYRCVKSDQRNDGDQWADLCSSGAGSRF